jgi:DNA repair exonuclease SbcCD ATPase subunit
MSINGVPVDATGKRNAKTILSERLNLDYDILMSTLFLTNKFEYSFTQKSPSGRKEYIEELSNSYALEKMKTNVTTYIDYLDSRVGLIQNCVSHINGKVGELDGIVREFTSDKSFTVLVKDINEDNKRVAELGETANNEILKEINRELYSAEQIYDSQRDKYSNIKSEIRKLESDLASLNKGVCPTCKRDFDNPELRKEYETSLNEKTEYYTELGARVQEFNKKVSDIRLQSNKVNESISIIQRILSGIDLKNKQLEEINKIAGYKLKIAKYKKSLDKFSSYKMDLNHILELATKFKSILSRDLRGIVLEDYLVSFEIELNKMSVYLKKDIRLKVNKNNIDILVNGRIYEKLSTGEAKRVDIVMQETFKRLHKKRTNLFFYDEIFDGLDITGIKSVIGLLEEMSVPESCTAIISHNPLVHDNLQNATLIKVIKIDGFSRLER